ncbi:MAG: DNA translocase FtsK [Chloroflexota bacterium]
MPPSKVSAPPPAFSQPPPSLLDRTFAVLLRFRRFARDVAGILLIALGLMTLLAMVAPSLGDGLLLEMWAQGLQWTLGLGSAFIAASLAGIGLALILPPREPPVAVPWGRIIALEIAALALLPLFSVLGGASPSRALGHDGGAVGWGLVEAVRLLGVNNLVVPGLLYLGIFCLAFYAGLIRGTTLEDWLAHHLAGTPRRQRTPVEPAVSVAPVSVDTAATPLKPAAANKKKRNLLPPQFRKQFKIEPEEEKPAGPPPPRDDRLPPLDLLINEGSGRMDERAINETAGMIEKTLAEFGIPAKVVGFKTGPVVTQFAVEPGFLEKPGATAEEEAERRKVRVAQIAGLQRDLTLALAAERLRIEAPVPGRPYVGIEVPNRRSSIVRLRPILESESFHKISSPLSVALGRDVSGQPVVADLERMPHLLIAGTTGSGKSICIAALTLCMVMNNTPADLRLVMIDPKMVELVRFNGLPHLLGKVETDVQRILGVLRWVVFEMDRRYKLLETLNARNIEAYNRKAGRRKGVETLPRIVVMIDELADLMMSAPDQTEPMLIRLAQLARATGIHLVVATQRPSTDVVTGLIKANFPARLSFAVASGVDSRVILDTAGAEALLGHGDMLFLPPDIGAPLRAQGVLVTDAEVEKIITFWQQNATGEAAPAPWEQLLAEMEVTSDKDNLVEKAIAYVRRTQRCSASLLQRQFRIGYPRAARLVDELEELGVVGPSQGGGREREVLVEPDDIEEQDEENQ